MPTNSPDRPADTTGYPVEAITLSKRFGSTRALDEATMRVAAGSVHAIVGENGAGKSTLVKIIAGVHGASSYEGELRVDGREAAFRSIPDAEAAGIFLVPQELHVIPHLTVAETLALGHEPGRFGVIDQHRMWADAVHWIERLKIGVDPAEPLGRLSPGQQQLVFVARALSRGARILILDEPTSALSDAEAALLMDEIREFHRLGVTTLYISHRLGEVFRVADSVCILRDGRVVSEPDLRTADTSPMELVEAMIGRRLEDVYPPGRESPESEVVLRVRSLTVEPRGGADRAPVVDADLDVRRGEIVGIFGQIGSGMWQLARALAGAWPGSVTGSVEVHGRRVALGTPAAAIRARIGFLPGDRKRDGLVLDMSVAQNLSLLTLGALSRGPVLDRARELALASRYVTGLGMKVTGPDQRVAELSGGTQQKVMVAKWMAADPSLLIMEEPTRGIDVGAKVEIYALMRELAVGDRGIVLMSTDLPEVLGMADRVYAMNAGRLVGGWPRAEATEQQVLAAATFDHEVQVA